MRHQIYTVIFMQGINRTSNVQNHIVVACDKFMGAHKHLPVFGIFNSHPLHFILWGRPKDLYHSTTSQTGHR